MHIAYLFDRPLPAKETDSEQVMKTVAALARRGVHVSLILPEVGGAQSGHAALHELKQYYQLDGDFEVHLVPNGFSRWSTGRKWQHASRALERAHALAPDVLYTRNFPTLFSLPKQALPYVYETYRPWADQFPPLKPAFRKALGQHNCLGSVLHSEFARARYEAWGISPEKLRVVLNGYEPKYFAQPLEQRAARELLGLAPDRKLVVYTGHINATKGLDMVWALAKRCPEIDFLLVGSEGNGFIEVMSRPYPNLRTVPWQPFDRTVLYLFAADVLMLPPSRIPLRVIGNTVLPMKLFLYLAAGRPVFAPHTPDTRELLHEEGSLDAVPNSVLVPPGDARNAAEALRALVFDAERCARLGAGARETARDLTWDARAARIEAFLNERLQARSNA